MIQAKESSININLDFILKLAFLRSVCLWKDYHSEWNLNSIGQEAVLHFVPTNVVHILPAFR